MAQQSLKELKAVADRAHKHVVYNPPEMIPQWQPEYDAELHAAAKAALDAGCSAEKVLGVLSVSTARALDSLPNKYLGLCVDAGLSADTNMDGETLLHKLLNVPYPIPLLDLASSSHDSQPPTSTAVPAQDDDGHDAAGDKDTARALLLRQLIPAGSNPACGGVTLQQLLRRRHTPNATDAAGNTAMHMVVACLVSKVHFPDPKLSSAEPEEDAMDYLQNDPQQRFRQQERQKAATAAAAPDPNRPETLQDHDAARAAYAGIAFQMLLEAGWLPGCRNANGYTVSNLIEAGLAKYQTELYDLVDPDGVAQTTVALLKERAPDKGLQEFLDAKVAGVRAVVKCLQEMHALAASADQPRKARSAGSLVLLWLLLLAACVYLLHVRNTKSAKV